MSRSTITPGDGDPRHGTENGYKNLKCKCPECTAAHAQQMRDYYTADPVRLERHRNRMKTRRQKQEKS